MTKTIWLITDETKVQTKLVYYHFGKEPKFPTWYMEADHVYEIKMIWNPKLVITPSTLFKCLTHCYCIR